MKHAASTAFTSAFLSVPLALGLGMSLGVGSAHAQSSISPATPYYLQGSVGATHLNADCTGTLNCDRNSTGYRIIGGYRWAPQWSVELGYVDWGKASSNSLVSTASVDAELTARGPQLGLAYWIPMTRDWDASLRFGASFNRGRASASSMLTDTSLNYSQLKTETYPYVGLGIHYQVSPGLQLLGAWDYTQVKFSVDSSPSSFSDRIDANMLSLGLSYSF